VPEERKNVNTWSKLKEKKQWPRTSDAYQGTISFTRNATLVDKDILRDRTALRRGNEAIPLLIGEPFDAS
jgi:hypothetical protein